MTTSSEIRDRFNLQYNNVLSGAAPGLDDYEISLYLTAAYKEVIYNSYSGNSKQESVDTSERMRSLLSPLITTFDISDSDDITPIPTIVPNYFTTEVAVDSTTWYILSETAYLNNNALKVVPITYDELNLIKGNPFKSPNKFRAWRLDRGNNGDRVVLIISIQPITRYTYSCVTLPAPIILSDLTLISAELSINGSTALSIPKELSNDWLLTKVINRACELATKDYKENNLNTQLSLNTRSE